jgi:NADP-reducing hydrogenase subunit HndC
MKTKRSMVLVSNDPASQKKGASEVYSQFSKELAAFNLTDEISLSMVSDISRDDIAPFVIVYPEAVIYGPVKPEDVHHLVEEHLYKGRVATALKAPTKQLTGPISWIADRKGTLPAEQRIVLERAGVIDPDSIEEYVIHDGYTALGKALTGMTPQQVINEIKESNLRGRGGAGFPTGSKWGFVASAAGDQKYVICNADESEPGTFKDRLILEGDPHSIIEAMTIAAYAVGASEGYIYIRGEYSLAQTRLVNAIQQAKELGFLGEHIFGTDFSFDIQIHAGAGAYICGEETALIESIEGKRGEPRPRPPYPTTNGLWDKPTLVNNVETLANVAPIIRNGAAWFNSYGNPSSAGTKVYTILGDVNVTGLIEVPMGITLREVISIYAKGMKNGAKLKLAQTGGSSGSIIPADLQDVPMDYDSFAKAGVTMGSGALLICSEKTCVVDLAKVLINFFRFESCGKCNPCRIGNQRAYQILTKISEGLGTEKDLADLGDISKWLYEMSNCGLGQTAGAPLKDVMHHFVNEVETHINQKECPAGVCKMSGTMPAQK